METLSPSSETRPQSEWWFSLQPGLSDEARLEGIKQATRRYEARFGFPPAELPRVVMVGKTPMLAYATPVTPPLTEPHSAIIADPTEQHIMQLMLL